MLVLIEFEKKPLLFKDPLRIIRCDRPDDLVPCFDRMEQAARDGFFLAGFLSYEAGYAFEENLKENRSCDFPLLQFGVYPFPLSPSPREREGNIGKGSQKVMANISFADYSRNINIIKSHIAAGNTYQITYCIKYEFDFDGDSLPLYRRLLRDQPVPYPAFIQTDDFSILSLSPEMFVKKEKDRIVTKPMKGTWPRSDNLWEDLWAKRMLHRDPKNRAENVMIADLLRNDLGKISRSGTVKTPKLFEVARYTTLCQMTSTVCGNIGTGTGIFDIFKSLFPSGSVTGAPKIRSMGIIREIEKEDRKIYTGAIGYITPQNDLFFNVPIRTLLLRNGRGEMGVGGGIVWDSTPEGEWAECELKSRFLTSR